MSQQFQKIEVSLEKRVIFKTLQKQTKPIFFHHCWCFIEFFRNSLVQEIFCYKMLELNVKKPQTTIKDKKLKTPYTVQRFIKRTVSWTVYQRVCTEYMNSLILCIQYIIIIKNCNKNYNCSFIIT